MLIKYNGHRYPRVVGGGHDKVFFHQAPRDVVEVDDKIAYLILQENVKRGDVWDFTITDKMPEIKEAPPPIVPVKEAKPAKVVVKTASAPPRPKGKVAMNATKKSDVKKWRAKK